MPRYGLAHLDELASLERELADLTRGYESVMHCDLRLDNVLIDASGAAWLSDWNHVCLGPAWFDTMSLLLMAYARGLDADELFLGHPTASAGASAGLDPGLAGIAGFHLRRADWPSDASRHLGAHQRWSGEMAPAWLADRRAEVMGGPVPVLAGA